MSDLLHSLSIAARALDAQRYGLDVTGQNIANVNTPGFTRRTIQFEAVPPHDAHDAGGGVDVASVTASRAPLLAARLVREAPLSARESAIADHLALLEAALGAPGSSIDGRLSDFYGSFAALAADPASMTVRQQVLTKAQSLSMDFQAMARRLDTSVRDADTEVRAQVEKVNELATTISSLNAAIGSVGAASTAVESLRDQRDTAIQSLSEVVDIDVITRDDNSIDISIGNGRALVVGENHYDLSTTSSNPNSTAAIMSGSTDISAEITGGRVGGLLQVRDVLIPGYADRLDQLAYGVATDVNAAHTGGYDRTGTAGQVFFVAPTAVSGSAAAFSVNAAVAGDPRLIAAAGSPSAGDNQVARAIADLQDRPMTGTSARPVEAWAEFVSRVGTDASAATQYRDARDEIISQIKKLSEQITGVSIDEEAATMLRFQRAYEANARFFSAADQSLTVLLNMVRA